MVLDCCWSPDGAFFATASRDRSVKLWTLGADAVWSAKHTIKLTESITAVDMIRAGPKTILAIGTESGAVSIHDIQQDTLEANLLHQVDEG